MSSRTKSNVVAVLDRHDACGAIVFWRLSGTVDIDRLAEAWTKGGLPECLLPGAPEASTALRRAVHELTERRRLARPLAKRGAWALVAESIAGDDDPTYSVELRVTLDDVDQLSIDPPNHKLANELRASFQASLGRLIDTDISAWLVKLAGISQAVALRDTGGTYFIPQHAVSTWDMMTAVLESVSANKVFGIPAMQSEKAVEAILDAVVREAESEAAGMENELSEGDLGGRALKGRAAKCEALAKKVKSYEELLGRSLDALQARLSGLDCNLAAAALAAMKDDEDEAAQGEYGHGH